jgi:hypothetical protein
MDFVPKESRSRWKSLESVSVVGWCGSALLGGFLSDKFDYSITFLFTAVIQFTGALIYLSIIGLVPREGDQDNASSVKPEVVKPVINGDDIATLNQPLLP